jgi:hypothetical protein
LNQPVVDAEISLSIRQPGLMGNAVVDRGVAGGKKVEVGPNGFQYVMRESPSRAETATQA